MKKKILSWIIKKLEPKELYAFVSATILELSRRSGLDHDDIISSVHTLIELMKENNDVRDIS